ncbi:hypothetical protein IL306_011519 [Fusarium sp. DS 682]|nr:hypothetical protein IL306_011519 [Fusarium sp. DS 682]
MSRYDPDHSSVTASSATSKSDMAQSNDGLDRINRLTVDDVSPAEDDDDYSDTTSHYSTISEDTLPLIREYGHTYHGSGQLLTPNDASEAHRLTVQHELYQLCLNGNLVDSKLPLDQYTPDDPMEILDVGAGTGIWACDMAKRYPQTNILGIDLSSALLPEDVPPNVTFEIADATETWPNRTYDFIHMRSLAGGGVRDWNALLADAYEHLNPGGMIEIAEIRPHFFDADPEQIDSESGEKGEVGAACKEYEKIFGELCDKLNIDCDPIPRVPGILNTLGADLIRERVDWLPIQNWGSDPVTLQKRKTLAEMIECVGPAEMQDPKLRSIGKVTFVTARKEIVIGK